MNRLSVICASTITISLALNSVSALAQCVIPDTVPSSAYTYTANHHYTSTPNGHQSIDLWLPTNVTTPPVVVAIHGGSFQFGIDGNYTSFAERLSTFGIATASINYRLVKNGQNVFPAAISDARCAVRWLSANAASLHINASAIAAIGRSAGGNIAGLLGTGADPGGAFDATPDCLVPAGAQPPVLAVADYYGLNDIGDAAAMNSTQTVNATVYLGVAPQSDIPLAMEASPITYVAAGLPPFFVARGAKDSIMPEAQATLMVSALQSAGVPVQYYNVKGLGHGFDPLDVAGHPQLLPSACALVSFFQAAFAGAQP